MYKGSYDSYAAERAKELRKNMTEQERRLWYGFLRKYPVKFYRQRAVGTYILDFYCSRARLAVELDGGQHYEEQGAAYDRLRTEDLNRQGIAVLRFSNTDVDRNFRGVCAEIERVVNLRMQADKADKR